MPSLRPLAFDLYGRTMTQDAAGGAMKVYIAGPMSGHADWNFPAFFTAESELTALGHVAVNPAHNDGTDLASALASAGSPDRPTNTWAWYMRRDLQHVSEVDAICLLPGWQTSRGANLEVHVARALGLPLYVLDGGALVPRVRVVGLSGYAGSGKDTLGAAMVNEGWLRASFADPLRDAVYRLNPIVSTRTGLRVRDYVDFNGWDKAKRDQPELRELLQRMGTEVGRDLFGTDFWVDLTFRNLPDAARVVITDCRFPNEAAAVHAVGGEVWRIVRPGCEPTNAHPSETALDDFRFDRTVLNDGDIADLVARAASLGTAA